MLRGSAAVHLYDSLDHQLSSLGSCTSGRPAVALVRATLGDHGIGKSAICAHHGVFDWWPAPAEDVLQGHSRHIATLARD